MTQGMSLLNEALELAHREMVALNDGAYDVAVELAERRNAVTSMAWKEFNDDDTEQYRSRLQQLASMQRYLTKAASKAYETLKVQLQRSRVERQRMRGYHRSITHALVH